MIKEKEAREKIRTLVAEYYHEYVEPGQGYKPGDRISYASRVFDQDEMSALVDSALDFWLTAGRYADRFEKEFAEWLGVKHAHLVNSGSSANLLAFMALTAPELGERRIKRGDEVITAACGFPTTVSPIVNYGAVPVFVDVALPGCNIDVARLEKALSSRTKAVMIAHTLGNPFDVKTVTEFCREHGLWLIEDNCDALGSLYTLDGEKRLTGTFGDISTCSFYPPHHMTMGEGGCVCTDDPLLSRLVLSFRDWGRDCVCPPGCDDSCGHRFDGQHGSLPEGYDHKYVYSHFGYNCKITDLQAAIGCEQLKKLDGFTETRKSNWRLLREGLDGTPGLILPEAEQGSDPSWFGFLMLADPSEGVSRNRMTTFLEEHGVQTRLLFAGDLTRQPCFDTMREGTDYRVAGELTGTERAMKDAFWVGVYPGLTEDMIGYMIKTIKEAAAAARSE